MAERSIQNTIRNALAGAAHIFRGNVGEGWTGEATRLPDGSVLIRNPRRFGTGLPTGFSDLFGWRTVTVTPDMVGRKIAVFTAIECKTQRGRLRPEQESFLRAVRESGGFAGVARSADDARAIIDGDHK